MNRFNYIIAIALFSFLLSSCHTTTHTHRKGTFRPDVVELRINVSDLIFLGETEISVSYSTYLGLFSVLHEINGSPYDPTHKNTARVEGINFGINSKLDKAVYKVISEHPTAAYFQVVYQKKNTHRLFLGKEVQKTALVRAYALNTRTLQVAE